MWLNKLLALMLVTRQVVNLIQHQILRQWLQIATLAKLQTETFIIMANSLLFFLIMECATVSDAQVPATNFSLLFLANKIFKKNDSSLVQKHQ